MVADTTAVELIAQARAANSMGRPATAEQLLRRAIRTLARNGANVEDLQLRGSATVALASPVFERRGLDPALAVLTEADRLITGPDGDGVRILSLVQRAGLLARGGEWRVAVELLSSIGSSNPWLTERQLIAVHLNRAAARQYLGDHRASLSDLQVALELAAAADCLDLEFKARHNLGYSHFLTGDVPRALATMAEADRMEVDVARATAKRDYARVLLESGLTDEAAPLLGEALAIATERRLHQEVGEVLVDTARLELLRGRPDRAETAASDAARLFRRRRADGWWAQAEILRAEAALAQGTSSRAARRMTTRLRELSSESRAVRRDALLVATEASLAAGDIDHARDLFRHTRGTPASPPARLRQDWLAARLALAAGDRPRARRRLRDAAQRVASLQGRPASLDARTAFALHAQRLARLDVEIALETGSAQQALAATERWRAASARLPSLLPHADATLDALFTRLRDLRGQLRASPGDASTDALTRDIENLERQIRRREWELADHDDVRPKRLARASEVAEHAAATDSDVISLFATGDRLHAVSISADGIRLHDLGDAVAVAELSRRVLADLGTARRSLPGRLADVVRRSLTHGTDRLAALLPAPRTRRHLVLVTTRVLRSVPWRLVPGLDDRPVIVTPSLTSWLAGNPDLPGTRGVVALAGPGLPRAPLETAAVEGAWAGRKAVAVHDAATGSDLADALAGADLVHVAAHGHHHEQNALFSSLSMHDGPLFAYELQRHGVRAEHVVLSACDIGRAMMRAGDESIGLTATLLACGARSVVAAVAPVDDDAAADLMSAYHRYLAGGMPSSVALERATTDSPWPDQARLFCTYGSNWVASGPAN